MHSAATPRSVSQPRQELGRRQQVGHDVVRRDAPSARHRAAQHPVLGRVSIQPSRSRL